MAVPLSFCMDAFLRRTRMGLGNERWPSRDTSSTINEIFDFQREYDMIALEAIPSKAVTSTSIATVAGTMDYPDISGGSTALYGRRIRTMRVRNSTTSADSDPLTFIEYDEVAQRFPRILDGTEAAGIGFRSRPTHWTEIPGSGGTIRLLPVPDRVYDVRVEWEVEPPLYALPAQVDWYGADIDADGRTRVTTDSSVTAGRLTRLYPDRPRDLKIYVRDNDIPGVKGAGTYLVTVVGYSVDGLERSETVDITGFEAGVDVGTSTVYWDELQYIGVPDLSSTDPTPQLVFGTGSTFDTTNIGRQVTTNSVIPLDAWAERLGPIGAASEYFYSEGDRDEGNRLKQEFYENLEKFIQAVSRPPQQRVTMFDSGLGGPGYHRRGYNLFAS